MSDPPPDSDSTHTSASTGGEPARIIGPYRLVERIGFGGMGEVWLAEQRTPVHRRVALKLIRAGMDSAHVLARFDTERQALALMDHQSIAKIFDAGNTPEGRPYFVMEHVPGVPITEHCRRQRLTTAERLNLMIQVCEGIQHAHQKAVIHRDLKPSNVLVSMQDGRPVPKIIDFGLAKALSHRLTERTLHTELGVLLGTPEYMSPEQAERTGQDVDTRTDVYSLGVILYELLTGALPFEPRRLREAGALQMVQILRDEDPPSPSRRVSGFSQEASTEAARERTSEPALLRRQLEGDLDWITMKALEKDRARRYGSASELAEDIRRHLDDEPVLAGRPTVGYRARKFARRHRVAVVAASGVAIALALGIVATASALVRARRAETAARREAATADRVAGFMANALGDADPHRMGRLLIEDLRQRAAGQQPDPAFDLRLSQLSGTDTARRLLGEEILERAGKAVDAEMPDDPQIAARLQHTIARTYHRLGLDDFAEMYAARALATRQRLFGPDDPETLRSTALTGDIRYGQGRFAEAETMHRQALSGFNRVLGRENPETLRSMNSTAFALRALGRHDESEKLYEESLALHRKVLGPESRQTLGVVNDLGFLYQSEERYGDAERLHRANLAIRTRVLGPEHNDTLWSVYNVAWACLSQGRTEEAAALFTTCFDIRRKTLGRDHPDTVWTLPMLARVAATQSRYDDARNLYRQAVEAWPRAFGASHPDILWSQSGAAYSAYMIGDLVEARRVLEEALAAHRRAGHADDDEQAMFASGLLREVYWAGEWTDDARRLDRAMLPLWRGAIGRVRASYDGELGIAMALLDGGRAAHAEAEEALPHAEKAAASHPMLCSCFTSTSQAYVALALAHHLLGHRSEAVKFQRDALAKLSGVEKAMRKRLESDLARYERTSHP